jgi:aryl-alcohol dehydrogenase-like predicted oxidoreductase
MNFGDAWKDFMGEYDKKSTFEILDFFCESGGNFRDTAIIIRMGRARSGLVGGWRKGESEEQMVVATKWVSNCRNTGAIADENRFSNSFAVGNIQSNFGGNGTKSLRLFVNTSLQKLRTSYIDLVCSTLASLIFHFRFQV